eukprot:scaffold14670_cov108-Isochrysis_galbana.AAC.6
MDVSGGRVHQGVAARLRLLQPALHSRELRPCLRQFSPKAIPRRRLRLGHSRRLIPRSREHLFESNQLRSRLIKLRAPRRHRLTPGGRPNLRLAPRRLCLAPPRLRLDSCLLSLSERGAHPSQLCPHGLVPGRLGSRGGAGAGLGREKACRRL